MISSAREAVRSKLSAQAASMSALVKLIAANCASSMRRLVKEPGGHAPLIVFTDADVERAVDIAVDAKFSTSEQDCLAANRIHVQRPMLEAFTARCRETNAALKVGSGLDPETQIGPLMHARALAKVDPLVPDALARGGKLLIGGKAHPRIPLAYVPPLLAEVPDDALIHREETFGPVAAVTPFDTEDEAVARANASEYGLVTHLITKDGIRALRLSRALACGMAAVNRVKIAGGLIPFGGWKQSGLCREGAPHGMKPFTKLKYLCIDTAS